MTYSLVRKLLHYWIEPSGRQLALESGEAELNVNGPDHGKAGGPGSAFPDRSPPVLLAVKRAFDIMAASIGLVLFSPIFLLVSVAVKVDSRGPILRRHMQYGYNGEKIPVLKFRSNEITRKAVNGSRMTHVGRFLGSTGIEGLPQLINVLRGEMSIVGAEPFLADPTTILKDQISFHLRRHGMKPGITGWAQVNGCWEPTHTSEAMQRRIKYDLYYIERWSLFLDMKIIAMTALSRKAYAITA